MLKKIFLLVLVVAAVAWAQSQNILSQTNKEYDCRLPKGQPNSIECISLNPQCFSVNCNQNTGQCDVNPTNNQGCPPISDIYVNQRNGKFLQARSSIQEAARNTTEKRDVHSNLIKNGGFENYYSIFGFLSDWNFAQYPPIGPYFHYDNGNNHIDCFGNKSPQPAKGNGQAIVSFQGFCPFAAALYQEFYVNVVDDCITDLEISFKLSLHNTAPFNRFTINELLDINSLTDLCDGSQFFTASLFTEYYLLETFYSTSFSDGPSNFGYKKFKVSLEKVLQSGQSSGSVPLTLGFVAKATQGTFNIAIDDVYVKAVCHQK